MFFFSTAEPYEPYVQKKVIKIKILKSLWIVLKSMSVAEFYNILPKLLPKTTLKPRKMEISVEKYQLVSK